MGKFQKRVWTDQEIKLIRSSLSSKTWHEIAASIGVSERCVRDKARELRLRKINPIASDPARNSAIFNYSETYGIKATASHFDISIDSVKNVRRRVRHKRLIAKEKLTPEFIKKFRLTCIWEARKRGRSHDADEFASFAVIKLLEGRQASVKNLFTDYVREQTTHAPYHDESNDYTNCEGELEPKPLFDWFETANEAGLSRIERIVFLLVFKDSLTQREVCQYLQVSEGRVSQIMSEIQRKLRNLNNY